MKNGGVFTVQGVPHAATDLTEVVGCAGATGMEPSLLE